MVSVTSESTTFALTTCSVGAVQMSAAAASAPVIRGGRIYTLPNGETTSEHIEVPLTELSSHGKLSKSITLSAEKEKGLQFRYTPSGWDADFHNAPARQYIVM